uniref:DnaJ homolog subfamily C member 17 n=1 Tax=Rhinolophus ferrumequinum TaxID=59479 RepID=A0A671FFZ2_RHIFE
MVVTEELLQMDLYALLGIEEKAADKEVKKADMQKALSCHPDKNPDNPRAAELLHKLPQALEVLTDAAARAAYDKVRKAKKQAAERTHKLDEKRKKVKLDLEAQERRGFPAAGGAAEADPGADTQGIGTEGERKGRKSWRNPQAQAKMEVQEGGRVKRWLLQRCPPASFSKVWRCAQPGAFQ